MRYHKNRYLLLMLILSTLLLSACGGGITNATPAKNITLEADQNETLEFSVEGPVAEGDYEYIWSVKRFDNNNNELSSDILHIGGARKLQYQMTPDDQSALFTEIRAVYGWYETISYGIGGPIRVFHTVSGVTWEIVNKTLQSPPFWNGDVFVRNQNDVDRLQNFVTISGDLLITAASIKASDALNKLRHIEGNITATKIKSLNDFTNFGFSDQLEFSGDLSIIDNVSIKNLEGLGFLRNINSLTLTKNDWLESFTGMSSSVSVNSLTINNNPSLKSLAGLDSIQGSVASISIWGNNQLTQLSGLNSIQHVDNLEIGVFPGPRIPADQDLVDLNGLNGLESVGNLTVKDATKLESLSGLDNLRTAASIRIENAPRLASLAPLANIRDVATIELNELPMLAELAAFNDINPSLQTLKIEYCENLLNLHGLEKVSTIEYLEINPRGQHNHDDGKLVDLSGLEGLTSVGTLILRNNNNLLSLRGLDNLVEVGTLSLSYNNQLVDIDQLEKLTQLSELRVYENENLNYLPDLSHISHLDKLSLGYYHLIDLNGLNQLESAGNISIRFSDALQNADALSGLTHVSGDFEFTGSINVDTLDFSNLQYVGGNFKLVSNGSLSSLDVSSLTEVGADFVFYGNREMCTSNIEAIHDQVMAAGGIGGNIQIENNKGC